MKLYINGVLDSSNTDVITNIGYGSTHSMNIGRYPYNFQDSWGGKLDEIRIYNKVLNEQEIQALYLEGQSISATITIGDY